MKFIPQKANVAFSIYTGTNFLSVTLHFTLIQKVINGAYTIHTFVNEAILCRDSASYFDKNLNFLHERSSGKVPSFQKVTLFLRYKILYHPCQL